MAHLDFDRPSGQWYGISVFNQADGRRFDVAQSKGIDVVNGGGLYLPKTPIILGGAGVQLGSGCLLETGATTKQGGRIKLGTGDTAMVPLSPTRSRPILFSLLDAPGMVYGQAYPNSMRDETYAIPKYAFQGQPAVPLGVSIGGGLTLFQFSIPRRYIHGCLPTNASLASLVLNFRLTAKPASLPAPNQFPILILEGLNPAATSFQSLTPELGAAGNNTGVWQATHAYALNSYVVPTNANTNGYYFKATSISGTGTSGASEPVWPTVVGNTVTDNPGANQIVWTNMGFSGQMVPAANVDAFYNNGQPQSITINYDGTNRLDSATYRYIATVGGLTSSMLLHTLQFNYTYSALRFE